MKGRREQEWIEFRFQLWLPVMACVGRFGFQKEGTIMHKNSIKKVPVIKNPVCVMVSFSKTSYTFSQAKQKGESRHDGMNGTLDSSLPMTTATVGLGLLLFLYSRFTVLLFLPRSQPNNAHTHTHTHTATASSSVGR